MEDKPFQTVLIVIGLIVTVIILLLMSKEKIDERDKECPNEYEKFNIFPKEYKALLIKKNARNGKGMEKKPSQKSVDLNNQGKILHIPISGRISLSEVFDNKLWDYVVEGDSIFKERNSYQVKIVRGNTVKIFDIDCEQFKKELESENK